MKKLCIFLIEVNRVHYLLIGVLIGLIVYSQVDNVKDMIPTSDMSPLIYSFSAFGVLFINLIAMGMFYTDEERKTEDIHPYYGITWWDNYFSIKINTQLSLCKLWCGYVYVMLRVIIFIASGYLLCSIVCLLSNK